MSKIRRTKGTTCCVPGCYSDSANDRNVSFHVFPRDEKMREIWIERVNRRGKTGKDSLWEPTKHHRICGLHFNKTGKKTYDDKYPRFFPRKTYPPGFFENVVKEDFNSCYSRWVGNEVILADGNEGSESLSTSANLDIKASNSLVDTIKSEDEKNENSLTSEEIYLNSVANVVMIKTEDTDLSPPRNVEQIDTTNLILDEHSYNVPWIHHNDCGAIIKQFKEEIKQLRYELHENQKLAQKSRKLEEKVLDLERDVADRNRIILDQHKKIEDLRTRIEAQDNSC